MAVSYEEAACKLQIACTGGFLAAEMHWDKQWERDRLKLGRLELLLSRVRAHAEIACCSAHDAQKKAKNS